jgi:hypothetical protein
MLIEVVRGLGFLVVASLGCAGASPLGAPGGAGGTGGSPIDAAADAPVGATGAGGGAARAPANHRVAAPAHCPSERGPGTPAGSCVVGNITHCTTDADCTGGVNGRCMHGTVPIACGLDCSYDTCAVDSDCPDKTPCVCRASATDSAPNACAAGSNCRIDSDCGAGGYCSPSDPNQSCNGYFFFCDFTCGSGYFCHTPKDTCTDDTDCNGKPCLYNVDTQSWACGAGACSS